MGKGAQQQPLGYHAPLRPGHILSLPSPAWGRPPPSLTPLHRSVASSCDRKAASSAFRGRSLVWAGSRFGTPVRLLPGCAPRCRRPRAPAPETRERTPGGSGTGHPATPLSKFRSVDQRLDCGCCDLFHQLRTCSRGGTRPAQTVYSYPWCGPSPSRVGAGRDRGFNRGGSEREHKSGSPCIRLWTIKVDDRLTSFGGYCNRLTNLN